MTAEEARIRGVVLEVLEEALRSDRLDGLVMAAPPSPEAGLLARWVQGRIRLEVPAAHRVRTVADALDTPLEGAWAAAGIAQGLHRRLLPVHPAGKARLLLDPVPRVPCYPLGDLWSRELRAFAGEATLPAVLAAMSRDDADRTEEALRAGLDGGLGVDRATEGLEPEVAVAIRAAIRAGRTLARPPLVPKTGRWTLGIDPAP